MPTTVIILAAGQGKRMRSDLPKVLHPLAGQPLLHHVLASAGALKPREIRVVHGHGGGLVQAACLGQDLSWFHQSVQKGTGHAVQQALPKIPVGDVALILYGDVPLVMPSTLKKLVARAAKGQVAVLTAEMANPTGYGRILRGERGGITGIVEEKDATKVQRQIREINTGLIACPAGRLAKWIGRLKPNNVQKEYYLTDIIGLAVKDKVPVAAIAAESEDEVLGINDKAQLAAAEKILRRRRAAELMAAGVTLIDPERIDIRGELVCGRDVEIDADVIFEGVVHIGDGVRIGAFTLIRNTLVGAGTIIHPHCLLDDGIIGPRCEIGPYARVRPGVEMAEGGKLGNFVEVKNSVIGRASKVNHLSYIGDATIGDNVNVGAGTITCNYDGANKHRTVIGDGAFIGSGVELVAPVEIGAGATIGAGSTISKTAPAGQLTIERSRQLTIPGWKRPVKKA
ncbi:MAG: bifunctional UDP-N-acetylglucosamine diphosphorylase/glucosamine-1-phosphate N-acetyltransferase GlmU [Gammaproteobacteria bacterium]|nr:bifunctional UDP-N-acetylglucosamine diphosphorylase/glucosamine-1-phosphate N-acetyltransferase GlmU [Gammaproteobacteria bacterium]